MESDALTLDDTAPDPLTPFEDQPTKSTISLGGRWLNLSAMARMQHMDRSYLSRILNGRRDPGQMSLKQAMKLAACLGWSVEDLIDAIYERMKAIGRQHAQVALWHDYRMKEIAREERKAIREGRIPPPRIPLGEFS